ncbi:hypothetical protein [Candidatus Pantoea formicae]|uniref:hypothetical protein n=1 Tax=Candidatus Pantoea formicae TaxID=2608355 RepID=UPI003EDA67CF
MAMDKSRVQKIVVNTLVIIVLTALMAVASRYLAGYLLIRSFHLDYPLSFDSFSMIKDIIGETTNKKTKLIINAAIGLQIIMICLIPLMFVIALIAKKFKRESRFGDAKWATNTQLKNFEDQGAYRK